LPCDEIGQLGQRLGDFYDRFRSPICAKTRATSEYGLRYVSGLLRLKVKRTMAHIGRQTDVAEQNMHYLMNNSPWLGRALIAAL
jgi:hypothetical protein